MTTYNQNYKDGHSSDCSVYCLYQIIYLQYGLKIPYGYIEKTVDLSVKMGVLFPGGAVFDTMYNWFTKRIEKKYGITLYVKPYYIPNKIFYNKQYYQAFGLYLINGNKEYLKAVNKDRLTKLDIDRIASQGGGFKHNNCYYDGKLYEIYKGKEINCSVEVLRYGVEKGVFGMKARTLEFKKNAYHYAVYKYLQELRTKPDSSYFTSKLAVLKGEQLRGFQTAMKLKYLLK